MLDGQIRVGIGEIFLGKYKENGTYQKTQLPFRF